MIERKLSMVEIGLIAATRVVLGVGIGLLIAGRLNDGQRKRLGAGLAVAGGLSTIPLVIRVIGKGCSREELHQAA